MTQIDELAELVSIGAVRALERAATWLRWDGRPSDVTLETDWAHFTKADLAEARQRPLRRTRPGHPGGTPRRRFGSVACPVGGPDEMSNQLAGVPVAAGCRIVERSGGVS